MPFPKVETRATAGGIEKMANVRFQNALKRVPQATPPIWFMRQAGRYHRHYQELRARHTFMELCKEPELAAEVALGPIEDFDFDVAILFSDLLFPLEAMGMGLSYDPAPRLEWHLNKASIKKLRPFDEALGQLQFQREAMRRTRERLAADKSLIGFVGGPWTLFTYACEGEHKGGLASSKSELLLFEPFCDLLMPLLERNIGLQFEGGAEAVMILDTASGELEPHLFRQLIAPLIGRLARAFPGRLGYYLKGGSDAHLRHPVFGVADSGEQRPANAHGPGATSPLAGLGFDHRFDMEDVLRRYRLGFVQGNFDQSLLFLPPDAFRLQAERYLKNVARLTPEERSGWVCGLGHGIAPRTPEENVRAFVRLTREILR